MKTTSWHYSGVVEQKLLFKRQFGDTRRRFSSLQFSVVLNFGNLCGIFSPDRQQVANEIRSRLDALSGEFTNVYEKSRME